MEIIKLCIFALLCAFAIILLKEQSKSIAMLLTIASGICISFFILNQFINILGSLNNIIENTGIDFSLLKSVLKIVIIGYIAQITTDILEDMEIKSLSTKIAFCAKVLMISIAFPIINDLFLLISEVL